MTSTQRAAQEMEAKLKFAIDPQGIRQLPNS